MTSLAIKHGLNPLECPRFLSFTGVDEATHIGRMVDLSRSYPLEWGILVSPWSGTKVRYPSKSKVRQIVDYAKNYGHKNLHLSLHLCGQYAVDFFSHGIVEGWEDIFYSGVIGAVQVNLPDDTHFRKINGEPNPNYLSDLRWDGNKAPVVLQSQNQAMFPNPQPGITWLFDASKGKGLQPAAWPVSHTSALVGFAGGINPGNLLSVAKQVGSQCKEHPFYLDMETGCRGESNFFSLNACEDMAASLYGPPYLNDHTFRWRHP